MTHISSMHCGAPDTLLVGVDPQDKLPPLLAESLLKLYDRLVATKGYGEDRPRILVEIVDLVTSHKPRNFQEYLWYASFTAALILVKDLPISFTSYKTKIIMHTFQTPTELWDACPIKIHLVARHLFALLDDDYNLVFVINQICNLNRMTYYVAVALMWAALYRHSKQPTQMFRMHKIGNLIQLLSAVELQPPKVLESRLVDVHRLLTLVSVFQSLVILRKPRAEEYVCFRNFFRVTVADLKAIIDWLEDLKRKVEYLCSQKRENEKCLQIIEMLDLDILHFMDKKMKQETGGGGGSDEGMYAFKLAKI